LNPIKLNLSHHTPWRRLGERKYSSYSFLTSALRGGEWSASRPGRALALEIGPMVPIVQEAGWTLEPVWTQRLEEKSSCLYLGSNFNCPIVQSVDRHYTDWATPAPNKSVYTVIKIHLATSNDVWTQISNVFMK
jgi:hypothetical protein